MTAFQKAEALPGQRFDRDKLLAVVDEVTRHFRTPNSVERSKMQAGCRYLAMPRSLQRINPAIALERFREEVLAKWKSGVDRRGRTYWTWCVLSARMIVPSRDMLSYLRVNQWIAHLPENYP